MATECRSGSEFSFQFQPKLNVAFDGGEITSDAGLVLLRELDERLGLTAVLPKLVGDPRDTRFTAHELLTLLRQRRYQDRGRLRGRQRRHRAATRSDAVRGGRAGTGGVGLAANLVAAGERSRLGVDSAVGDPGHGVAVPL